MKKILIALFALTPMFGMAQSVKELTPEQKLEQAQKQLEEAQKAVAAAKANAEKAKKAAEEAAKKKADEEAKAAAKKAADEAKAKELAAKQAAIQEQIKKAQEEAARLNAEAERLKAEAEGTTAPATVEPAKKVEEAEPATPAVSYANKSGWNSPAVTSAMKKAAEKKVAKTDVGMDGYLAGAVPTVNDKVVFALDVDATGKSAKAIFDTTLEYLSYLITDDNQRTNESVPSNVSLVNEEEYTIAARMSEWLVFNSSFISLDRTEFNYTIIAKCADNRLHLTMERMSYNYEEGRATGFKASAEEIISDKESLNKAQTKLVKPYGKFRKATIDRKNEIFEGLKLALK